MNCEQNANEIRVFMFYPSGAVDLSTEIILGQGREKKFQRFWRLVEHSAS